MDDSARETNVEWRPWGPDAFAAARREGKPILLSLSARWCEWCRKMDEGAYSEPGLAANVNDGFVPVRVDADRNPRVRERYTVGGFPSTVFLTPQGDLLSGATYLDVEGLRSVVERVREAYAERGDDAGRVPRALRDTSPPAGEVTPEIERLVAGQVDTQYDDRFGGWGTDAKFPLPHTIRFALKRDREKAVGALDAVERSLHDDVDGGFFRYAAGRDWSDVQHEKLLESNAALLGTYADAYLATGEETYLDTAERTRDYLASTLWTGTAFGGSQEPGDYFERSEDERRDAEAPPIDATAFADGNAAAADALARLVAYTDDETGRDYAERTLRYLAETLLDEGAVRHYDAPESDRLLLADHARVTKAFATAAQVFGPGAGPGEGYRDLATSVADAAIGALRTDDGELLDGPAEGPGLLDRPLRPVDDNALFADALVDLSVLTGEERYREVATDAVGAFAGAADRFGPQVAMYATAASRLTRPPLQIAVAAAAGSDLHRAALRMADHEKVVVPEAEGEAFADGRAYVTTGEGWSDPAATPAELAERVAESA